MLGKQTTNRKKKIRILLALDRTWVYSDLADVNLANQELNRPVSCEPKCAAVKPTRVVSAQNGRSAIRAHAHDFDGSAHERFQPFDVLLGFAR